MDVETVKLMAAIAGLFAALVGFATALAQLRKAKSEKVRADAAIKQAEETRKQAEETQKALVAALPAPYTMSEWVSKVRLKTDGSGIVTRICRGVQARVAGEVRIPYNLASPAGTVGLAEFLKTPASPPGIRLDPLKSLPNRYEADVVLPAGSVLKPNSASFAIEHPVDRGFSKDREEANENFQTSRFKHEYFGTTVTSPAEHLVVEVTFPDEYPQAAGAAWATAFYGESEIENDEELARIRAGSGRTSFTRSGATAVLRVDAPLRGHHYAIAWDPPPQSEIESS